MVMTVVREGIASVVLRISLLAMVVTAMQLTDEKEMFPPPPYNSFLKASSIGGTTIDDVTGAGFYAQEAHGGFHWRVDNFTDGAPVWTEVPTVGANDQGAIATAVAHDGRVYVCKKTGALQQYLIQPDGTLGPEWGVDLGLFKGGGLADSNVLLHCWLHVHDAAALVSDSSSAADTPPSYLWLAYRSGCNPCGSDEVPTYAFSRISIPLTSTDVDNLNLECFPCYTGPVELSANEPNTAASAGDIAYIGRDNGRITRLDMSTGAQTHVDIGAGNYNALALPGTGPADVLYAGTQFGLAIKFHLPQLSIQDVLFAPGLTMRSVISDPRYGHILFAAADTATGRQGTLMRVQPAEFEPIETFELPADPTIRSVFQGGMALDMESVSDPDSQHFALLSPLTKNVVQPGGSFPVRSPYLARISLSDGCGNYTSCGECLGSADPYCAWCDVTSSCITSLSGANDTCADAGGTLRHINSQQCPVITTIAPDRAFVAADTPTLITVTGSGFDLLGAYQCRWSGGGQTPGTLAADRASLTCETPLRNASLGATSEQVSVMYQGSEVYATAAQPFLFYDCNWSASNCSSCVVPLQPACAWDYAADACVAGPAPHLVSEQCAAVQRVSPPGGPVAGGTSVALIGATPWPASNIHTCEWHGIGVVNATVDGTSLLCTAPTGVSGSFNVTAQLFAGAVSFPAPHGYTYTDCAAESDGACTGCGGSCAWCLSDNACALECSPDPELWALTDTSLCPALARAEPLLVAPGESVRVTVQVTTPVLSSVQSYECGFGQDARVPAVYVSADTLTCDSPASLPGGTKAALVILHHGRSLTQDSAAFVVAPVIGPARLGIAEWMAIGATMAVVAAAVASVVRAYHRRNLDLLKAAALKRPAMEEIRWRFLGVEASLRVSGQVSATRFDETLVSDPQFRLLLVMTNCIGIAELTRFTRASMALAEHRGAALQLMKLLIAREVADKETGFSGKFRSNSLVCRYWRVYVKLHGLDYLWDTLAEIINELAGACVRTAEQARLRHGSKSTDSRTTLLGGTTSSFTSLFSTQLEVDPTRVSDVATRQVNTLHLQVVTQKLLQAVVRSLGKVPVQLLHVLSSISQQVRDAYSGTVYHHRVIGKLFFTEMLCPAIVMPHRHGLLAEAPQPELGRQLILIAKVMQALASTAEVGVKEPYMATMSGFVTSNRTLVFRFINDLANHPRRVQPSSPMQLPPPVHEQCVMQTMLPLATHQDLILAGVQDDPSLQARVRSVLASPGAGTIGRSAGSGFLSTQSSGISFVSTTSVPR